MATKTNSPQGSECSRGLALDTGEEGQVERAGDLDGFQCEARRVKREGDGIDHLRVHQQLGTLTAVPQASLEREMMEKKKVVDRKYIKPVCLKTRQVRKVILVQNRLHEL